MKRIMWVLVAAAVSGCQPTTPVDTPSKQLEITMSDVRLDCVRSTFTDVLVSQGYQVVKSTDRMLDVSRKTHENTRDPLLSWTTGLPTRPTPANRSTRSRGTLTTRRAPKRWRRP